MAEKEYFIDDRCIIPESVKAMSKEELEREIQKIEERAAQKKQKLLKEKD